MQYWPEGTASPQSWSGNERMTEPSTGKSAAKVLWLEVVFFASALLQGYCIWAFGDLRR